MEVAMRNNISSTRVVLLASGLALSLSACAAYSPSSYGSSYGYVDQPAGYGYSGGPYYGQPAYVGPSVNFDFDSGWRGGRR
jgi:hypothetical protein